MKPIVLLDVDGPLADFVSAYLEAFRSLTGLPATHEHVTRWDIAECLAAHCVREGELGWEVGRISREVGKVVSAPGFASEMIRPHESAKEPVAKLEVADVYAVTSPWHSSPTWMHERTAWLKRHFKIPRERVIHASTKHLVRGDVFVDDKASHVTAWAGANREGMGVLFDMHHNRADNVVGVVRAGWPFVLSWTKSLAEGRSK